MAGALSRRWREVPHGRTQSVDASTGGTQRLTRLSTVVTGQTKQQVCGRNVIVVQETGFLLSEDHNPARPVGEAFKHDPR